MRVAGRFLNGAGLRARGGVGGGVIRDLHNDEPKSVACTADMLLSASMASGRKQIGDEQAAHGAPLSSHIKWLNPRPAVRHSRVTSSDAHERTRWRWEALTRLLSTANIGSPLQCGPPSREQIREKEGRKKK